MPFFSTVTASTIILSHHTSMQSSLVQGEQAARASGIGCEPNRMNGSTEGQRGKLSRSTADSEQDLKFDIAMNLIASVYSKPSHIASIAIMIIMMSCLSLTGCSTISKSTKKAAPRVAYFQKTNFSELGDWESDSHYSALLTFKKSCKVINKKDPSSKISPFGSISPWQKACKEAEKVRRSKDAKGFFEKWFTPYRITDEHGSSVGKFTGYYEIELEGSRKKSKSHQHPIYCPPANIKDMKGRDHLSHTSINKGSLANKGLEIAWVNSKVKLYFLHIQGSGVIKLDDGSEMKVGYAECNGFGYKGLDKCLKECSLPLNYAVNMQQLMKQDEVAALQIMERNPSYVFFREATDGPMGAQGVALDPVRSIAIDSGLFPYGTPFWLDTPGPVAGGKIRRLMVAQDRGGAIKGAIRADIFCGRGSKAERLANMLNHKGKYYALFPKDLKVPDKFISD